MQRYRTSCRAPAALPHLPEFRFPAHLPVALLLLITLWLSGCATYKDVVEDQRTQSARAGQAQQIVRQSAAPLAYLRQDITPRFASRSVPTDPSLNLPTHLGKLTLRLPGRHGLGQIAEQLSRLIELPVLVTPDALMDPALFQPGSITSTSTAATTTSSSALSSAAQTQSQAAALRATTVLFNDAELRTTFELNYTGSLRGFLDDLSARAGLQWRYNEGRIVLSRVVTRVIAVKAVSGGIAATTTMTAGTAINASSTASGNFWAALAVNLKEQVSVLGKIQVDERLGSVTVTDALPNVEAIERFINAQNELMMRQLTLEVEVLQVDLRQEQSTGINWAAVSSQLNGTLTLISPGSLGSYSGTSAASFSFIKGNDNAMLSLLEEFGKVNTTYSAVLTTTHRQPVPLGVTSKEGYLKSVTAGTVSATGGTSTGATLTADTITTGFSMLLTPTVLDSGRILLESMLSVSALRELKEFASGEGVLRNSIQLPAVDDFTTLQRLSVRAGETLVMTGFEREILLRDERDVIRGVVPASQRAKAARQSTVILITPRLSPP
jgi:type IVB pilus formation R64 PilN family outer membrane protein